MKITKLGHCCMVLEVGGATLLTDPGSFTTAQDSLTGIDAVLITHEHQDHFHIDSVKKILANNPGCAVVTNAAVGALLEKEGISHLSAGDSERAEVKGVEITGHGRDHAPIYQTMGLVENTGFMVGGQLYFPGDGFYNPGKPVEILALPVAGPWMKMAECIDFAKDIKARTAFGVHDGMIQPNFRGFVGMALKQFVPGTDYIVLGDGENKEF